MSATAPAPPWQGEEVPLAKVGSVLDQQYRDYREHRERSGASAAGLMRTRIATLLIVSDDREALAAALDDVREQPGGHPSRCIGLLTLPPARGAIVRSFARLAERGTGGRTYDEVVVEAAVPDEHLASVALPLLLPEIPVFTWWLGILPFGSELLEELLGVTDRLIVDSTTFADPVRGLARLARLTRNPASFRTKAGEDSLVVLPGPTATDLVWGRLTPWRELLATAFTGARQRAALDAVTEVTVTANEPAAGLLLVGWLASRLGWRLVAPAGSSAATDGGRARYRAGDREVSVTLLPDGDGRAALEQVRVTAVVDGGRDTVTVVDHGGALRATIEAEGQPSGPVAGGLCALSRTKALHGELSVFGRDRVFEDALSAAVAWVRGITR
jgi:glucose-6-phosphate dehydrogenase assembly protein OpcA